MTLQHSNTGSRGIEWTDETINPIGGCYHRCYWLMDGRLAPCYAKTVAHGQFSNVYHHGFEHTYWRPHLLDQIARPLSNPRHALRFLDSMSDLFGHWVPDEQIRAVLAAVKRNTGDVFQSLTKAPGRLGTFTEDIPANLWVGVSSPPDFMMAAAPDSDPRFGALPPARELTENQKRAYIHTTFRSLRDVKAATGNVVWMSVEPLSYDFAAWAPADSPLDWLVLGAATHGQKKYMPDVAHVHRLLAWADERGTPVFLKGNIRQLFDQNPSLGRWREDFPYRDTQPHADVLRARQARARLHGWAPNRDTRQRPKEGGMAQMPLF